MDQDAVIKLAEHAKSTVVERLVFQSMDAVAHRQDHTRQVSHYIYKTIAGHLHIQDHTRSRPTTSTYGSGCCNQACRTCQKYGGGKACISKHGCGGSSTRPYSKPSRPSTIQDHTRLAVTATTQTNIWIRML